MTTIRMTTVTGLSIDVNPVMIGHRWDVVSPFRIITYFYAGHILASLTEAEHRAELFAAATKVSMAAGNGALTSFAQVSQLQKAEAHYGYAAEMDSLSRSEWKKVPSHHQETLEFYLPMVAGAKLAQMMVRGDFERIPPPTSNNYDPVLHAGVLAARRYAISDDGEQMLERDSFGRVTLGHAHQNFGAKR